MKKQKLTINPEDETVSIDVHSSNIIPGYMFYLLQFHKLPKDTKIKFKDKTVVVEKQNYKYKYKEVK